MGYKLLKHNGKILHNADGAVLAKRTPDAYLTFSAPEEFSISVDNPGWDGTMEYSIDRKAWNTWDGSEILGTKLYIRGTGNMKIAGTGDKNDNIYGWTLTGSNITCKGNIETLLDYATVKAGEHPIMGEECYAYMFCGCSGLIEAPELPAPILTQQCYRSMFSGCSGLIEAPELPATTLASYCYLYMFYDCTGLTTTPKLPATTLSWGCYSHMFSGCSGLIEAPELPATILVNYCYTEMFRNCSNLTTAPELPATTLASCCYRFMFGGCTNLTTAPALPATTLENECYNYMFIGCTNLTTAPALPATTLENECYSYMFNNCISLKLSTTQTDEYTQPYRIPTSGEGTTAYNALQNMLNGTGGTFTGIPEINTTYYLHKDCSIV